MLYRICYEDTTEVFRCSRKLMQRVFALTSNKIQFAVYRGDVVIYQNPLESHT